MTIFEKNKEILDEYRPFLQKVLEEEEEVIVVDGYTQENEWVPVTVKDNHEYYLGSRYSVSEEAKAWAEVNKIEDNPYIPIIVFGIGNGMQIVELHKRYPENIIIAYEPSAKVFAELLKNVNCKEILSDDKIFVCAGKLGQGVFIEYLYELIQYSNAQLVKFIHLPGYTYLFEKEYLQIRIKYHEAIDMLIMSRNTLITMEDERNINYLHNLKDMISQYGAKSLAEKLIDEKITERPAIIVSAGPSLDKNIKILKKAKGKAFIIAVDTAINPMIKAGVKPDVVVTVDPHKPLVLFDNEDAKDISWVVDMAYNHQLAPLHNGKRFYYQEGDGYIAAIFKKYEKQRITFESGGSVACVACSLALNFGHKTIILIGQDLAYPDNKTHSFDAYGKEDGLEKGKTYFEVDDIYGNKVLTEGNMNAYRKWFESTILRHPDCKFIDATEGGAKINGTEILTLEQTIKRECEKYETVDIEKMVEEIEPLFTPGERMEIEQSFEEIPDKMQKIEKKLGDVKRMYGKMEEEVRKRNINVNRIKKQHKKIQEEMEIVKESPEARFIDLYNYVQTYLLDEKVFVIDKEKDERQEMLEVIEMGVTLADSQKDAVKKFMKDYPILLGKEN